MLLLDPSGTRRLLSRLAVLPTVGLVACSLIYDFSGVQCSETADCQALGAGTVCENSVCVTPEPADGQAGSDGVECTTNGDCIDAPDNYNEPAICRAGSCIQLKLLEPTDQCPWVLGVGDKYKNLRKPDPIIIGAYAPFGDSPAADPIVQNYELAIDEMNSGSNGGLSGGSGGTKRPFIAVVCQSIYDADLTRSMGHLIDTLQVPAIISALNTPELEDTFSMFGQSSEVFFMSPLDADTTLTLLDDDGLLWHQLPEGRDLAPGYLALMPEIEAWIHAERGLAPTDPIKVAVVEANDQFLLDISNDVVDDLEYNGGSAFANEDIGKFIRLRTPVADFGDSSAIASAKAALLDFVPDVILSIGARESLQLIYELEVLDWPPTLGPKPFYVVSPGAFGATELLTFVPGEAHQRMLGVNFAAAEESDLYNRYLSNLKAAYGNGDASDSNLEGKENFYDAAYFVMYAIASAGNPPRLTGKEVAAGMLRLINPGSKDQLFEMGSTDVPMALYALGSGLDIGLTGTLGPPDFNTATGARVGAGSIYCVEDGVRIQNALLVDPDTGMLSGTQTCVPNFPPP